MNTPEPPAGKSRHFTGLFLIILALLLLAGGWTIPFSFESFSILYKFGLQKTLLRSGKVVGISIVLLVFYQLLLASRFRVLEQVFSARQLFSAHRLNGRLIAGLVLSHPLLIKASENFTPYTFEKKYYPEFLGIALLGVLLLLSLTAIFKGFFRLPHNTWLLLHRSSATLVILLLPAHILYVSETFKSGIPNYAGVVIFCLNLALVIRIWLRRRNAKAK